MRSNTGKDEGRNNLHDQMHPIASSVEARPARPRRSRKPLRIAA